MILNNMHLWNNTFKPKDGSPYVPQVQITGIYASYCRVELSSLTSQQRIHAYTHVCDIQSFLNNISSFSTEMKSFYQNALISMLHSLVHDCLHVRFCMSDKHAQFQLFRKCDFEETTVSVQIELANAICNYTKQCIGMDLHKKQSCKRKHTSNDANVSNKKHHA